MIRINVIAVVAIPLLLTSCGAIKKNAAKLGVGEDPEEKKNRETQMVRPENTQGLLPNSDKAVHAARRLHTKLFPGESGDRVISAANDSTGRVMIYMDKAKPGTQPKTYWVGCLDDGKWMAYEKVPRTEDFEFVFKELSKEHLASKGPGRVKIIDFNLVDGDGSEREVRIRYAIAGKVDSRKLTFIKDNKTGWSVTNDVSIERVF